MCIYWFKGNKSVAQKITANEIDDIAISAITLAELLYGAYNSASIDKNLSRIKAFEEAVNVLNLDRECFEQFAKIKAKLRVEGKILDDFDILIAATAIVNNCIIVTNNIKHFERVKGVKIENWIE